MPIQNCTVNGKHGKKYGETGKCYTGPDAEKKAAAIKASKPTTVISG